MSQRFIKVTYNAKPDVPDCIHHTFPLMELTEVCSRTFKLAEWNEAWTFMTQCTNSITSLRQLIHAFPRNIGKKILDLLDEGYLIDEKGKWMDLSNRIRNKKHRSLELITNLSYEDLF